MPYRLLDQFVSTFEGTRYRHRDSSHGDKIAVELYEDLVTIGKSVTLVKRITTQECVVNTQNVRRGVKARRGDGTFGELIPHAPATVISPFGVARGQVATVEIGVEVKIMFKAMIKQIDRVIGDLRKQVEQFHRGGGNPICIGIVGINSAGHCTGYEGKRAYKTNGRNHKHPIQEASEAEARLVAEAKPSFDELLILRFRATNERPYRFEWVDPQATNLDYGAILTRISREYDHRFGK